MTATRMLRFSFVPFLTVGRRPSAAAPSMTTARSRTGIRVLVLCAVAALLPAAAHAQSLAGIVRDTSGAVLPGVVVEASSAALIEKTRSTVTDDRGQYQIVDLRPGTYKVTFTLPGFVTVVRDAVELTGGGATTVSADMRVGDIQETVTVTGEAAGVDLQTSTSREIVLSGETVQSLPASRGYGNLLAVVPGITTAGPVAFSSAANPANPFFSARGGRSSEGNMQIDGMNVGASVGGGGVSGYYYDLNNAAEVQVTIAGGLAEVDRGGPAINVVPKTGGNKFSGTYFGSVAGEWAQSSNIDAELASYNFTELPALIRNWDQSFTMSGPVLRDRLWFFGNMRTVGTEQDAPNLYGNKNVNDPNNWNFEKDTGVKVRNANSKRLVSGRLTWQATPRNKLGFYIDYTKNCTGSSVIANGGQCRSPGDGWTAAGPPIGPGVATTSPESGTILDARSKIMQATWTAPVSSRFLIEAGFSSFWTEWGDIRPAGAKTDQIPVTESTTRLGTPYETPQANYTYHGWPATGGTIQQNANYRASVSYVTGSHNLKVGYQGAYLISKTPTFVGQQLAYRVTNGTANTLTQRIGSSLSSNRTVPDAVFAQDQWTRGRLTLQGGLRYEHVYSFFPEGENGYEDHQFGPGFQFPRTDGVRGFNDITPRFGGAYDLFGNGKTAVKVSMSKYLEAAYNGPPYTTANPAVTLIPSITRGWTDLDQDWVADCDYLNPNPNQECQGWSNLNWGKQGTTTTVNPYVQKGWNKRNYDWQFSVGVQHEIVPRVSVDVAYSRRWWGNFFVTHNRALTAADYDEVTLTAPTNPDLPGGGGYPVTFLTRNTKSALGATDSYYTTTADFGDETHYWHGVDVSATARFAPGLVLQGGTSTGRGVNDTCDVETGRYGRPFRTINGQPACNTTDPFLTSARGLATYTLPKVDVLVSAIFRSQPNVQPGADVGTNGASRTANYQMTPAQFLAATGRPLRPGLSSETVNLLLQGDVYGDRINALDMRFSKILRFKGTRGNIGVDLYNMLNSNTPTTYESTYNPDPAQNTWLRPTAVVQPRFVRVNFQFDF